MSDLFTHPWMSGLFGDPDTNAALGADKQLAQMLMVERAYTMARLAVGDIEKADADAVCDVLDNVQLTPEELTAGVTQDGLVVPAMIRLLKAQLPQEHHHALHVGLTSQDVIDTALVLSLRPVLDDFAARLDTLDNDLCALSARHGSNPLMGRTRMQAALPITVADRIATWQMPLASHRDRLRRSAQAVIVLSIGGPVGIRMNDDIAAGMAQMLGLQLPAKAPHTMRADLADLANTLSLVTGTLGKFGQDVALMAQQGIESIQLSGGGSSSAMAHKNNPIVAELLVTLAGYNATQLPAMHHAIVHEQERSGAAWALEWMTLPDMLRATGASLRNAIQLVGQVTYIGDRADASLSR
ncbi:3-carboxy-cis,cis-muconate cycloisomerase [Yoonia sediminilitoris]|uniref:3-carboxy-cis,cis-muconate cycloisomerase n=1 Tax=Yoonia sediminilitoris TaxID=1286148 RepID=A0A2T6KMN0_9RHOB|nr:3-carboxy-cis,cis-muconate cycloisomerase [Yoonia sediminilitoris]PUB17434.1 3-carboxy-cis,cis-muconate cycloisomerase [Yoonia sediminilitoris]RCW97729.1 3-carboxy-cis,cis-muconate cycloisomerase [Yoonia sediminilitoris]